MPEMHDFIVPRLSSGPCEIIASGSVISYLGNPISITCGLKNLPINLVINFQEDKANKEQRISGQIISPSSLLLTFFNISNLGSGSINPVEIGNFLGHKTFLHFRAYSLSGSSDTLLHYSIFMGEEVKNG